ncbi:LacI family DNA-binding transcriptional regulator [Mangrovicoccus algicola]|uniref:LacI family DNA-binding transcriptional regulator n=1 Tax=Mangrovicoccus algicola TaxID=2771008 RepID=A0A8J6YZ16_9RHOB|nr:LacI family DNA-binding transcriptional regulator [Mangrovicoccus algicola]MBE3640432.1 LacI family DNA-binding transcriptional regulator [Mangrovicoccus algicola]
MAEKVTAQMVAERAGVSQSAVSRVFTPGASVSARTEKKVREAASALGYRPNVLARAMVSGRSRMIGLVVAYLENQFYPEVLEKLSNALQAEGYHILVFMASQEAGTLDTVVEEILDYQVEGIVLASVSLSSDLASRCQAAGVPVVLFNRSQDIDGISAVTSDNFTGAFQVGQFLLAGEHERIAYLAGWEGASTQRDRQRGFVAALDVAGRRLHAWEDGRFEPSRTADAVRIMFDRSSRPDAVFVAGDQMALIAMDVLRHELGLSVPGDVSVVGFDDVPAASWLSYRLTTVRQQADLMVARCVSTLLRAIETPGAAPERHAIEAPLILRASARIPQGWTQ